MSIFELAHKQLEREGKLNSKNYSSLLIDRAVTIRKWFDIQERNRTNAQKRYKKVVTVCG